MSIHFERELSFAVLSLSVDHGKSIPPELDHEIPKRTDARKKVTDTGGSHFVVVNGVNEESAKSPSVGKTKPIDTVHSNEEVTSLVYSKVDPISVDASEVDRVVREPATKNHKQTTLRGDQALPSLARNIAHFTTTVTSPPEPTTTAYEGGYPVVVWSTKTKANEPLTGTGLKTPLPIKGKIKHLSCRTSPGGHRVTEGEDEVLLEVGLPLLKSAFVRTSAAAVGVSTNPPSGPPTTARTTLN